MHNFQNFPSKPSAHRTKTPNGVTASISQCDNCCPVCSDCLAWRDNALETGVPGKQFVLYTLHACILPIDHYHHHFHTHTYVLTPRLGAKLVKAILQPDSRIKSPMFIFTERRLCNRCHDVTMSRCRDTRQEPEQRRGGDVGA